MGTATEIALLKQENLYLKQEVAVLKKMIFGAKRERFEPGSKDQAALDFGEGENLCQAVETPTETVIRKKKTGQKQPVRQFLAPHLPRVTKELAPEGIDPEKAKKIGEAITEYLEYEPGKMHVVKIVRPKFKTADEQIHIAELPVLPIPKGNVGPLLLAHVLVGKFVDHLPLYRQRKQFKRDGVDIAESTLTDWVRKGCQSLEMLYGALVKNIQQSRYLMADETPFPVQTSEKKGSTHKGYHWVYFSPRDKLVAFQYHKSRGREAPDGFLEGFTGHLQTDGYAVYDKFGLKAGITLLACMAHARRKFHDAKDQDRKRAEHALKLFGKLYKLEEKAREGKFTAEQRLALRQEKAVPVLGEMHAWMKNELVEALPKSAIGKAISYSLGLWERLTLYTTDGNLEIDNNFVENKIRPVALGRKNYLFAGSHNGAHNAAIIYSFFANCKLHDINPREWLADIFQRLPNHNIQKLDELLPNNWKPLT